MNWILSGLFYVVIFGCYKIIGRYFANLFDFEDNNYNSFKDVFIGFIMIFFLGFIIGFPYQVLHLSWSMFKYTFFISLLLLVLYCFHKNQEYYKISILNINKKILENIKNNWVIYVMTFVFIIFAITNTLVYYQNNYDDAYYLGKIVNSIGTNALASENYFNGANAFEPLYRMINTYEITYGFFSDIFNISVPFFCRVTMAIHNYYLVFSLYKLLAEYFVKKEISQYCILPFILLLVPSGYMMDGNLPISLHMYDGWQFQTAMFYGGSIVRTMALPAIFVFTIGLIKKINYKNCIFIIILFITFMAFSTVFLVYAVIVTLVLFLCKGIIMYKSSASKNIKDNLVPLACIFIPAILLLLSKLLDKFSFIATENFYANIIQYTEFSNRYFFSDTLTYYALAIFVFAYFIFKKEVSRFISLVMLLLFMMIFSNYFKDIIIVSSGFYSFVGLRFVTSIQMMILYFFGLSIVYCIQNIKYRYIIASISTILVLIVVPLFIVKNIDNIKQINWLGSGITIEGYTLDSITNNDKMMPDIMCQVGDYFNSKEYGNYRLLLPATIKWNGHDLQTNGFVFASNRIELCTYGGADELNQEDLEELYAYLSNEKSYLDIQSILYDHDISYILVQKVDQKDNLLKNGWTLELSSDKISETYYLLKRI